MALRTPFMSNNLLISILRKYKTTPWDEREDLGSSVHRAEIGIAMSGMATKVENLTRAKMVSFLYFPKYFK